MNHHILLKPNKITIFAVVGLAVGIGEWLSVGYLVSSNSQSQRLPTVEPIATGTEPLLISTSGYVSTNIIGWHECQDAPGTLCYGWLTVKAPAYGNETSLYNIPVP